MTPSSTCMNGPEGRLVSGDALLEGVGAQGWYQRRLLWLFVLPVCFFLPVVCLNVLMQVTAPDHWCHVPGRPDSVSLDQWRQRTLPRRRLPGGSATHSRCLMFSAALTNATDDWRNTTYDAGATPAASSNQTAGVTACQFGWEFDRNDFSETAVSAFQWVCDQSQESTRLLTTSSVGNLLGSIVFGWLADRLGRRLVFFLLAVLQPLVSVAGVLAAQPTVFIVMRFFAALCYPVMYQLVFTIGMEFTGVSRRTCYAVVVSMAFTLGMCALPLVAYLLNDWVHLGLASALPTLLFLPCFWFIS
ncbi:beta-alanine transporter-like [Pollicipes pollicipes]|uniref:beta-alanine transporter-like n=1 Tax=Pollicipes pollicipes TaxID=41117 RepID=UPI0018852706|nr:beta-alanine transporter-like [Pollicipes pollicipes]